MEKRISSNWDVRALRTRNSQQGIFGKGRLYTKMCQMLLLLPPGFCEHKTDVPLWEKGLSKEERLTVFTVASMGR